MIEIFWFEIPVWYAMIWFWLYTLWLYCGVKIVLLAKK